MKRGRCPSVQSREAHGHITLSDEALMYSMIMHMTCVAANVVLSETISLRPRCFAG